jgi:pimeloyl-ACP methyl ester carboxylesterase
VLTKRSIKALLVTTACALAVLSTSVTPARVASATPMVKNIVLVHGAFADGSSWAKVIPLLEAQGLNVTAVQNPLTSLADDVAATNRAVARQDGPVILVGHSWAGMVISEAGNNPKVVGLVYFSALVPESGQSALDGLKGYPSAPGNAETKADTAGYLTMTLQGIREDFVPDLPAANQALVYATQGDWNSTCLSDKVMSPAWKTKPSWYGVAANDRMIPPEYEQAMAKHIHATTTTLPSGHVSLLAVPDRVAAIIVDAASKAGQK